MNKVYVVKSVNTNDFGVMVDDKGLGVFLTYEEARKCFEDNVADLKQLYKETHTPYEDYSCDEDEFYIKNYNNGDTDFVSIYECEIGKWNS